jgi:hypothetical protein
MSHSFPSSRGSSTCLWYTVGGTVSEILEQRSIHVKFYVKIGKSASETLALLMLAYGEYVMKKSRVLNGIGCSRKGEKICKMTQEVGSQPKMRRTDANANSMNLGALRLKIRRETNRRFEYGIWNKVFIVFIISVLSFT